MKVYHFAAAGLFCLFMSVGSIAHAQSLNKAFSFGFGFEGGVPGGNAGTSYDFTGGLTLRFSAHAGPGFVTLSSGALIWAPKSFQGKSTKASLQIPVLAGYKFVFAKPFFVMGEIGYSSFKVYYNGGSGKVASTSYSGFTYAPTVGVTFHAFELGIQYESTSLNGGSLSAAKLKLGFYF